MSQVKEARVLKANDGSFVITANTEQGSNISTQKTFTDLTKGLDEFFNTPDVVEVPTPVQADGQPVVQ